MKEYYLYIILIIALILAAGFATFYLWQKPNAVACTMEAKLCPDGSSVGRTGPNCEFNACPVH